jgi:tRNA modification GTPase
MNQKLYIEDTITALATPVGEGAIGVIRISGVDAIEILSKIFKGSTSVEKFQSHKLYFGKIINPENQEIKDEVLVVSMKAPQSFTGEDIVEIHAHGGSFSLNQVLKLITNHGARLAEAGEFSKRAYLNGKIDLTQAEAIADLIHAKNEWAVKNALSQLDGSLSKIISNLREKLLHLIARIELGFDFIEEDVTLFENSEVLQLLNNIQNEILELTDSFQTGKIYKDGLKIALIGKPNVGKSSLLNLLLKQEKAIVHDQAGTTRDIVEGERYIHGIQTQFFDTAGIRSSDDEIEVRGIQKSKEIIKKADLTLAILDQSRPLDDEDNHILELLDDKKTILVINKTDLKPNWDQADPKLPQLDKIEISVKNNQGIEALKDQIFSKTIHQELKQENNYVLNNVRYKQNLDNVVLNIKDIIQKIENHLISEEILAFELKSIIQLLENIIGKMDSEDILDEIFSNFCIGK